MQEDINNEVDQISALQAIDNSGVTKNKNYTIENLRSQTLDLSGAVYTYGDKNGNLQLMERVNFKKTVLSKMTPAKLQAAASITLEEAKKIPAADLLKAGISAEELTAYENIVNYFETISESPREAQIETSGYTKRLSELFAASTKLYKDKLDRLSHQFRSKAPEFYFKYRAARKVIKRGPN